METDTSGALIVELAGRPGTGSSSGRSCRTSPSGCGPCCKGTAHRDDLHAILVTGGTGISPRPDLRDGLGPPDQAAAGLRRTVPDAELCRDRPGLHAEPGRGRVDGPAVLLVMPGSRAAVELAMTKIILPELPHLVREARKH